MLKWAEPDARGTRRAHDEHALYVISRGDDGGYRVGYFPSPGPECPWKARLPTVEDAMAEAERCAAHVHQVSLQAAMKRCGPRRSRTAGIMRKIGMFMSVTGCLTVLFAALGRNLACPAWLEQSGAPSWAFPILWTVAGLAIYWAWRPAGRDEAAN